MRKMLLTTTLLLTATLMLAGPGPAAAQTAATAADGGSPFDWSAPPTAEGAALERFALSIASGAAAAAERADAPAAEADWPAADSGEPPNSQDQAPNGQEPAPGRGDEAMADAKARGTDCVEAAAENAIHALIWGDGAKRWAARTGWDCRHDGQSLLGGLLGGILGR